MPSKTEALKEVESFYFAVQAAMPTIVGKCTTDAEREHAISLFFAAKDTWLKAVNSILADNNPLVASTTSELAKTTASLRGSLDNIVNVVTVLKIIGEGVKLAATIAVIAATV